MGVVNVAQVEMEIRELLEKYGFDSTNTPVIAGSALCALDVCSTLFIEVL